VARGPQSPSVLARGPHATRRMFCWLWPAPDLSFLEHLLKGARNCVTHLTPKCLSHRLKRRSFTCDPQEGQGHWLITFSLTTLCHFSLEPRSLLLPLTGRDHHKGTKAVSSGLTLFPAKSSTCFLLSPSLCAQQFCPKIRPHNQNV
jgi:hypothetical protein